MGDVIIYKISPCNLTWGYPARIKLT